MSLRSWLSLVPAAAAVAGLSIIASGPAVAASGDQVLGPGQSMIADTPSSSLSSAESTLGVPTFMLTVISGGMQVYEDEPVAPDGASGYGTWSVHVPVTGSGRTVLTMQTDGNLVLYVAGRARWATNTFEHGDHLVMQSDGNLVVYDATGRARWATGTGHAELGSGYRLNPGQVLRWNGTPGRPLTKLIMQGDGNLVEYAGSRAIWDSRTFYAGSFAAMQSDGNLVIYRPGGKAVWATHTFGQDTVLEVGSCSVQVMRYQPYPLTIWSRSATC